MNLIPSDEQSKIVTTLLSDSNVLVDAVAGSGKTTTICWIAQACPEANILLLTYNRKLKYETKQRLKSWKIKSVQTHTYHSFCFNFYDVFGGTDQIILDVLEKTDSNQERSPTFEYDLIIIDEVQDITPLYYSLVTHIVKSSKFVPKICVLGDPRQTIYEFNGADSRFLTLAPQLFSFGSNPYPWVRCGLSTSYRLGSKVCDFINNVVLKKLGFIKPRPESSQNINPDVKPRYIFCDAFGSAPIKELTHHYLVKFGYTYNDIFVLAPSINSDLSPVKSLANNLSSNFNIPIFIPTSDTDKLDAELITNKLVFATFHQAKGLERKCVLIFGFDSSYFYYYKQDVDKQICPNEIYVGLTRCTERMTLIHHYKKSWLDFIDPTLISTYAYTERVDSTGLLENPSPGIRINCSIANKIMRFHSKAESLNKKPRLTVTKLLSHLPAHIVAQALANVQVCKLNQTPKRYNSKLINPFDDPDEADELGSEDFYINIRSKASSGIDCIEDVSEIIGTGIPVYYSWVKTGRIDFIPWLDQLLWLTQTNPAYKSVHNRYKELKKILNNSSVDQSHIFELVAIYLGMTNNLIHKITQISNYKFVTKENLKLCVKRLDSNLSPSTKTRFEEFYEATMTVDISGYEVPLGRSPEGTNIPIERVITGFVDCVDTSTNTIWEFKCLGGTIQPIHLLQLAIYGWVAAKSDLRIYNLQILNIISGEKYQIKATSEQLNQVVKTILKYKFTAQPKLSDDEFIKKLIN